MVYARAASGFRPGRAPIFVLVAPASAIPPTIPTGLVEL